MLVAEGCKKDRKLACPEDDVRDRDDKWPLVGTASPDRPTTGDLNAICRDCDDWEPIHKTPESRIFESCDLVDTTRCPHYQVIPAFVESEARAAHIDKEFCEPCRLFHPGEGA